ncbi:microtubule-actin cross-linking factor 1 isoform X3 [Biomphalaria glabrata]|nr:microtubule-actin cross-linking factor 1 isoform X3 [Biomphalaria glabrata]
MAGFVSKSPAGSSHSSGSSYSGRSNSTASGPITKIREKTVHQSPWKQTSKTMPDGEVHQIMEHLEPDGAKITKLKVTQELRSPRTLQSPVSGRSSRASNSSRPTSRAGSEASDDQPEVYTTVQSEKRNVGGRTDTTVTYQTHMLQTRNVTLPTVSTTKISRIPLADPELWSGGGDFFPNPNPNAQ